MFYICFCSTALGEICFHKCAAYSWEKSININDFAMYDKEKTNNRSH